jgi:hypothetical protein
MKRRACKNSVHSSINDYKPAAVRGPTDWGHFQISWAIYQEYIQGFFEQGRYDSERSREMWAARQATFDIGNKYRQMESSDVVMKISRVVDRSSHGSSKVVTRCRQCRRGRRGRILVVTSVVTCPEQ